MRIAQVAPLAEAVPPKFYGGTERVVSWLTEALVDGGHEVTLFASGDSVTRATLVPGCPRGLRLTGVREHLASHLVMLDQVHRRQGEFDIIHFHVDLLQFPMFQDIAWKTVTTLHGRLDLPDCHPVYHAFPGMPLVSISDNQRLPMPGAVNWAATIYHGLPSSLCAFNPHGGDYLAFLGRISPEKGPERAIAISKLSGMGLKIAAKVDAVDRDYFDKMISPLLDDPLIEFIGEINDEQKNEFLGGAKALLFPIDWCEPFGLVMIEAMSCGTPIIAWNNGSVPEIMSDGASGFVVNSIEAAVAAVGRLDELSRAGVRAHFAEKFTAMRMASNYVAVYERLLAAEKASRAETVVSLKPLQRYVSAPDLSLNGGPPAEKPLIGDLLEPNSRGRENLQIETRVVKSLGSS